MTISARARSVFRPKPIPAALVRKLVKARIAENMSHSNKSRQRRGALSLAARAGGLNTRSGSILSHYNLVSVLRILPHFGSPLSILSLRNDYLVDTTIQPTDDGLETMKTIESTDEGETFGLSVFLRDGNEIYHTCFANGAWRRASWQRRLDLPRPDTLWAAEDSPKGWPQTPPYTGWHYHDSY